MKNLRQLRILVLMLATLSLTGCLFPEDKGAVEAVATPLPGEGNFTVAPPAEQPPTNVGNQEPSQPPSQPVVVPPPQPQEPEFFFNIDNGRPYSSQDTLNIFIRTDLPTYFNYKLSANQTCSGGQWELLDETLQTTKLVTNFAKNSLLHYSVIFRDVDGTLSDCMKASIVHDNQGPLILFTKYPVGTLEEGSTGEIIVEVKDISPITSVTCSLNAISKPCLAGTNVVSLTQMPAGTYNFEVKALDIHGFESKSNVTWTVVNRVRYLTHTVNVKDDRKVDILIVIDNSGSMEYEQQSMASRVRNMLAILRGLDYRIAVTTTDPSATRTTNGVRFYGDGDLIPIVGLNGQLWVDSNMNETSAQDLLGRTLQRPETGSGSEQGIRATYRFIEKATAVGQSINFFRDGANFATLVISDEDESANTEKNDPAKLLELISTRFNSQKAYSWHSIVTKPGDTACRNTHGAAYGERYKIITGLTGGILGSVCETDYASQVNGIATEIRNLVKNITLTCEPLSTHPITVTRNGVAFTVPFTVEGVNLKFADTLEPGEYKVNHACLRQ